MKAISYIILLILVSPVSTSAGFFGPSNYDECVLDNMKGVTSDQAARAIQAACRKKFPIEKEDLSKYDSITEEKLDNISGRAGIQFGNYFGGYLYNGNGDVTIKQVTIVIETKIGNEMKNNEYIIDIDIKPLETKNFGVSILTGDSEEDYNWKIRDAKGF